MTNKASVLFDKRAVSKLKMALLSFMGADSGFQAGSWSFPSTPFCRVCGFFGDFVIGLLVALCVL
ncbi:hypothetical protein [Marinobacter sp. NFXS9]|uniref:hypothetical protein n=1 Tax=Marinobacter sp. NFXS9 TaxID=2818433 RepID=UPI0032DF143D